MPRTRTALTATKAFVVRLPADLHRRLKRLVAREDLSMNRLVRAALRDFLKRKGA